jgi:hypothetical protein
VQAGASRVKMDTDVPTIFIGTADLTLVTDASNDLGHLLGGGIVRFPVLQQFNTFSNAHMAVSATP